MLALAAPDKFRGSLTGPEAARALAEGARRAGWECRMLPLADGGEGTLDALGGANRASVVTGPLGAPVEAGWRLDGGRAVVEAALASGLAAAGGAEGNDPVAATTRGTGELIAAALETGATELIVGLGGSASTDGGLGAVEALEWRPFEARVRVACDVRTPFLDAAAVFAPQKGASPEQVGALAHRLRELALRYSDELGIDVTTIEGSGAAGGLAGGLAALGAELVPGFELIAAELQLERALDGVDLVVTGEGRLDRDPSRSTRERSSAASSRRRRGEAFPRSSSRARSLLGHSPACRRSRCSSDTAAHAPSPSPPPASPRPSGTPSQQAATE